MKEKYYSKESRAGILIKLGRQIPKEPATWEKQMWIRNLPHAVLQGGDSGTRRREIQEQQPLSSTLEAYNCT